MSVAGEGPSHGVARAQQGEKYVVARVDEIGEGERKLFDAGGREIAVFRVDDEFYALLNRCPHQGGPLCYGELVRPVSSTRPGEYKVDAKRRLIVCPWHGWEFDLQTGRSYFDPARFRTRPFPVEVEEGRAIREQVSDLNGTGGGLVEGVYRAPLLPVEIEEEYIVVTVTGRRPRDAKSRVPSQGSAAE